MSRVYKTFKEQVQQLERETGKKIIDFAEDKAFEQFERFFVIFFRIAFAAVIVGMICRFFI